MKAILAMILYFVFTFLIGCKQWHIQQSFKNEAIADAYLQTYQYANAINYYEKAYQYRKEAILAFKLGDSYLLNSDFEQAEKSYAPYIDAYQSYASYCKQYAKLCMNVEAYDKAKVWWQRYSTLTKDQVDWRLSACDSAKSWLRNPQAAIAIKHLPALNTPFSEVCPAFYPKGLVFASSRPGVFIEKESGSTGEPFFDLYFAAMTNDTTFFAPSFFSLTINTPAHETAATFDSSGTVIYYTQSETDTTNTLKIKILQSEKKLLHWSKPKQFMLNDSIASFGQPFMNPKGTVFVFASNIQGGYGGTDLYISFKKGNGWTKPENLGPIINSSENEYYPFLTSTGDLYFTSDGHLGMGGYDIFVSKFTSKGWAKVANMKAPINSAYDDLSIILAPNAQYGYFSSNRKGGKGKEDLYWFKVK
jgi:peptidoglycan-associated lipoprotein